MQAVRRCIVFDELALPIVLVDHLRRPTIGEAPWALRLVLLLLAAVAVTSLGIRSSVASGTFQNMDFEGAHDIPSLDPQSHPWVLPASDGLPHWTSYTYGAATDAVVYNEVALDSSEISIHDTNSPFEDVLQGHYSVGLQVSFDGTAVPFITQTGSIPASAKSLRLLSEPLFPSAQPWFINVFFNGQRILLSNRWQVPGGSASMLAWDISAFAGQTGELKISGNGVIDDIQFTPDPIPPRLTEAHAHGDGGFEFKIEGGTAVSYTVQFSTNLVNWISLTNASGASEPITIVDPTSTNVVARYYRTVSP